MSSVGFSMDGDNVGAGKRKRKSKRRTSILKSQSPSRTALGDLDPNAAEQKKKDAKSKRRSSKRVSFADTFQVQEFWTEHHAKELGLWDTSHEGEQSNKGKSQENPDDAQPETSAARSEDPTDVYGASEPQEQPGSGDVSVGPGHRITGLETLLTGQIRNADPGDNVSQSGTAQSTEPDTPAVEHLQPSVLELSSHGSKSVAPSTTNETYIPQTTQPDNVIQNKQPESRTKINSTRSSSESTSESDEQDAIMIINKKHSRRSLTMIGAPNYLCQMPNNDSSVSMSISIDPTGHQDLADAGHSSFNTTHGTADMDLTRCQMSFRHKDTLMHEQDSPDEHTDNRSFFQKFMGSNKASSFEPWTGVVPHSQGDDDVFDDEESPEEKIDNRSFFQQFMNNKQESHHFDVKSRGVVAAGDSPAEKLDSKSFLASLMGGNSSKTGVEVPAPAELNDKTQIFREDETVAGMDLTTCVGGMHTSLSNRRPLQERIEAYGNPDMTVRFGDHNNDGDMELTTCYGGSRQPAPTTRSQKQAASGKADITQIFDQSGAMELTTCVGNITGNDHTQGTGSPTRNTTKFTITNISGLSFMQKTYSNVTLDNTTTILRNIDSALGLKRKSDVPPESLQGVQADKLRRNEVPHESTRAFTDFVPRLPGVREDDRAGLALSPIKKETGDNTQVICGEETAAIEFTGCIEGAGFTNIPQTNSMESTRIFQAEDMAGNELPTCVGNEKLQTGNHIHGRQQHVPGGDKTRIFSAEDSGEMEMTECNTLIVPHEMPSLKTKTSAALERTKIFTPDDTCGMEFTSCVDDLIVRNTQGKGFRSLTKSDVNKQNQPAKDVDKTKVFQPGSTCEIKCIDDLKVQNRESTGNTTLNKADVTKQNQTTRDMDKTKVYQPDETCGMDFTTCVDNLIVHNMSNRETTGNTTLNKTDMTKHSQTNDADTTKVFQPNETCGMEFTTCVDNLIVRNTSNRETTENATLHKTSVTQSSQPGKDLDKTKVFQPDETCGMEFTTCVDNLIVQNTSSRKSTGKTTLNKIDMTNQTGKDLDKSKVYQPNETCGMELTTCVDNLIVQNTSNKEFTGNTTLKKTGVEQPSLPGKDLDITKVFQPDDTCGMEFTTCVDNLIVRNTSSRESTGNTSLNKIDMTNQSKTAKDLDKTKVFQPDETCGMEFTTCVDNLTVQNTSNREATRNTTLHKISMTQPRQPGKDLDKTKVFQPDETCGMEFTTCVDNLIVRNASNGESVVNTTLNKTGKVQPSQPAEDTDKTKVYQLDDTCGMELTTCDGNSLPNVQSAAASCSEKHESALQSQLEPTAERTKIYQSDETCGMEFTTCVGNMIESKNVTSYVSKGRTENSNFNDIAKKEIIKSVCKRESNQSNRGQEDVDRTRIFSEETGNMEMTECIDSHVPAQQQTKHNASRHVSASMPDGEVTKVFAEDTAKMDMTECIGGVLGTTSSSSSQKENSHTASVSCANQEDQTKVFADNAGMDMTECIGGVIPASNQSFMSKLSSKPTARSTMERTMLFMSENTAKMDMTECVGGLFPDFKCESAGEQNQASDKDGLETECTRVFSENTARMDMTECVGGVFPSFAPTSNSSASVGRQSKLQSESEHTTVFSENTAKMEMTECVGSVFPTFASNSALSVSAVGQRNLQQEPEHTTVFSENTAKMEMTECDGSMFPIVAHHSLAEKHQETTAAATECTRVFSEDTGKMDMTECMGEVFPLFASNSGIHSAKKDMPNRNKSVLEHTKVFSEDTGRMDMTECVGGVFPSFAPKPSASHADDKENTPPVSRLSPPKHSAFTSREELNKSREHGQMSNLQVSSAGVKAMQDSNDDKMHSTLDRTQVFSCNDGAMEMTECVSINDIVRDEKFSTTKTSVADVTNAFSEHTARMEMTECVGNVPLELSQAASVVGSVNVNDRSVKEQDNLGEHTRVFSENTAKMDLTECVSAVVCTAGARKFAEELAKPVWSKNREEVDGKIEIPVASEQHKVETSGALEEEEKRRSDTFTLKTSEENVGNETKRSSDTFTVTNTLPAASQDNQKGEDVIIQKDEELRKSDTFTIDKPGKECEDSKASQLGDTQGMETQVESTRTESAAKDERHSSVESYVGDGIMEEETLVLDNTEDFHMIPGFSALIKKGFKEPDVTALNLDIELSKDISALEASGLAACASQPSSSSSSQVSTTVSRLSQGDKSALATSVLETNTLPTTGPVPMEEFLDFLSIAGTFPKGRRSMMEPVSVAPPETLGDFLELSLVTHPKHQMFEWANDYLASSIEKMRESIKEQETRMSKQNPAIVKEMQHATPERCENLKKKVVSLHGACKKSVKNKFREWRKKMTTSTLESLKKTHEELESSMSTICKSTEKINDALKDLQQYDSEMDVVLDQLASTNLPTEEEQQKYLLEGEQLEKINEEVNKLKETIDLFEKQKVELKNDVKVMQTAREEIELECQHLACGSSVPEFDQDEALERINRVHRMQEWTLEEYKHDGSQAHFTFLEGSLSLIFKLGSKIGGDESFEREITDVSYESLLADDACIAAKVANTLGLRAVDVAAIKRQTPTTRSIPPVLQQLSSKLCPARLMYDEVANIAFWHQVSLCDSRLTVEFSSLEACLKFYATFDLSPGTYPMKPLHHAYRHKIGQNMESQVRDALSSVKPGWNYLSRLITSIENLIQTRIPKHLEY